jgi:molecular chaperone GrpE
MTGDRDGREEESTPLRVTDKRRFANAGNGGNDAPAEEAGASPTVHEGAPPEVRPEGGLTIGIGEGVDETAAELEATRATAEEYREHLQRLQAEFDNYRKRVLKEQTQAIEHAAEPAIRRLMEVLDDFELALMAAADKPDFDRFLHGVELVYAKLVDALRAEGLEPIDAEGKPFDPEQHEALMQTGEGEGEPVVADVLRRGYTLKGRVIRPAGVRVDRS